MEMCYYKLSAATADTLASRKRQQCMIATTNTSASRPVLMFVRVQGLFAVRLPKLSTRLPVIHKHCNGSAEEEATHYCLVREKSPSDYREGGGESQSSGHVMGLVLICLVFNKEGKLPVRDCTK